MARRSAASGFGDVAKADSLDVPADNKALANLQLLQSAVRHGLVPQVGLLILGFGHRALPTVSWSGVHCASTPTHSHVDLPAQVPFSCPTSQQYSMFVMY